MKICGLYINFTYYLFYSIILLLVFIRSHLLDRDQALYYGADLPQRIYSIILDIIIIIIIVIIIIVIIIIVMMRSHCNTTRIYAVLL